MAAEKKRGAGKHAASSSKTKNNSNAKSGSGPSKNRKPVGGLLALLIAAFIVLGAAFAGVYYLYFYNKVYPGVTVDGVSFSGMTKKQVLAELDKRFSNASPASGKLSVHVGDKSYDISFDKDAASYDLAATTREVFEQGRTGSLGERLKKLSDMRRNGQEVELAVTVNGDVLRSQVNTIADDFNVSAVSSSYRIDGDELVLDKGRTGVKVDASALLAYINDKFAKGDFSDGEFRVDTSDPPPLDLEAIHKAVTVEMSEPYLDYENDPTCETVVEGTRGVSFDIDAAKKAVSSAQDQLVRIPLVYTEPSMTAEELRQMLFRDELGKCTTSFNANLIGRTVNVKLAGEHVNGTVVMPGEEFSYNKTVGERTEARGFKYGTIYANGTTEDGIGGGICQTSSTIYSACLRADMEIVERHNHSRVVTYVPLGEDATVSWGSLDYRFKNNTEFPIKLVITSTGSTITCTILGTQTVPGKTVKMENNTLSTNPFEVVYKLDPNLERGTQQVKNNGFSGAVVESYRLVYINGELQSRTFESKSTYYRLDKTILYNPWVDGGGPDDPKPEETTTTTAIQPTEIQPTDPLPDENGDQSDTETTYPWDTPRS